MSERQVLPQEVEVKVREALDMISVLNAPRGTEGARSWVMSIPARLDYDPDLVISGAIYALQNSLAQSEAERERLQGWAQEWHKVVEVALTVRGLSPALSAEEASAALTDDIEARKESWTFADEEQIVSLRAELAREGERNQELRQVVKEYRLEHKAVYGCEDGDLCCTCNHAALLEAKAEPQPAPVVTGEK